jgi:hypothetical protein
LDVVFVESSASLNGNMAQNGKTHARNHAEMKNVSHSKKIGENINVMGISKKACNGCHTTLTNKNIEIEREKGDNRVTNWSPDNEIETVVVHKENRNNKYEANLKFASNNIDLSKKGLVRNAKNSMVNSLKPGASVGVISGILQMKDTIENGNFEPFADASELNAKAGVCKNLLDVGETAYARASVFDAKAGIGGVAGIGCSVLSASAHAEYGLNNSIGANATVARVQGNVGPVQAGKYSFYRFNSFCVFFYNHSFL